MDGRQPVELGTEQDWRELRRAVRGRTRDEDLADDVVQEAWLRMLRRPPSRAEGLLPWLLVVARRLVWEVRRSEHNRRHRERASAREELIPGAEHELELRESRLLRMVEELRQPYREVVRLRYLEGHEIGEIAARLGRSEGTIRSQIQRGLDLLRARLDAGGERGLRRASLLSLLFLPRAAPRPEGVGRAGLRTLAWTLAGAAILLVGAWTVLRSPDASVPVSLAGSSHPSADEVGAAAVPRAFPPARIVETAALVAGDTAGASVGPTRPERAPIVLHGRTVFRVDGTPVGDARVRYESDGGARGEVVADASGRFLLELDRLPAWIWAEHDEHWPTRLVRVGPHPLPGGDELVLLFMVEGRIRGSIVDETGRGIEGAEVLVHDLGFEREGFGPFARLERDAPTVVRVTDARGEFEAPITNSKRARLDVRARGFEPASAEAYPGDELLRIALRSGTEPPVSAAAGSTKVVPLAGAVVRGRLVGTCGSSDAGLWVRAVSTGFDRPVRAAVDPSGRFELGPVTAGRGALWVEGGGVHGAWRALELEFRSEGELGVGTIHLPCPGALEGSFRDASGGPLVPGAIRIEGECGEVAFYRRVGGLGFWVDPNRGEFRIDRVWPGDYRVHALAVWHRVDGVPVKVAPVETTHVAVTAETGFRIVLEARAPRPLAADEDFELAIANGAGARWSPVEWSVLPSVGPGLALRFRCVLPLDAERVELRSTHGLRSSVEFAGLERAQAVQLRIELAQGERPGARAAGGG